MSPTNFTASSARLLRLILHSVGWLFLIDVLVSIFLAQFYLYWYSDGEWDPVKSQKRKETPELCITISLWMYASLRTYLKLYSLEVVPRRDNSSPVHQTHRNDVTPQRPRSTASTVQSPTLPQQPITTPVSHLDNAAGPKSQHTLNKDFQRELTELLGSMAASGRVSRRPKNDLVQKREQADDKEPLQVAAPRHRQPPTHLSSFVFPSFPTEPFLSRSLLPPIVRAADTPTTGASAISEGVQSRDLVPLNYSKDARLVPSGNSLKDDTSLPDLKETLQEDDTAATRGGSSNPMGASDPAASAEPTSGDQSTTRQSTADCNDGSRESSPDDDSEEIDTWREQFLLGLNKLPYGPSKKELRDRIQFFHDRIGMTQDELDEARKPYERVCYRQSPRSSEPFEVDGRPETYQLDLIKCWVNFNLHLIGRPPVWPTDYNPVCTNKELLDAEFFAQDDDAFSKYTIQSETASTLDE